MTNLIANPRFSGRNMRRSKGNLGALEYGVDSKAFELIYRQYWSELCKYIFKTFGAGPPDPQDVAQEAFAKFANLENTDQIENKRAYLYRTARNIVLEHKRKEIVAGAYIDDALYRSGGIVLEELTPERIIIERERFSIVNLAFKGLTQKQKIVLTLKQYHGATFAEITKRTGWSTGDVSRQLSTALDILNEALIAAKVSDEYRPEDS